MFESTFKLMILGVWREVIHDDRVLALPIACPWSENNRAELFFDFSNEEEREPQAVYIDGKVLDEEYLWVIGDYLKKRKR